MGPSHHLWLCAFKTAPLGPEFQVSMGPRPHLWVFKFKTATLAQELQVSMGPRPHLSSTLICAFCKQNSDFKTRITSLYGSQTSPMAFCIQIGD